MATTPSANLDFDSIKSNIIAAIKSDQTFTDYNFEGSALNALADILANNTFNNAFLASAAHAENFLDSAQRRPSVVSRATEMGYTPTSVACSTAYINVTAKNVTTTQLLPRGLSFSSTNENGTYTFNVVNDASSVTVGDDQVFENVKISEGVLVTNYFTVDTLTNIRSIFSIPNENIDTTTLKVFVKDSNNAIDKREYIKANNEFGSTNVSTVYFLQESYSGKYQIYFGNDVIGKQPVDGSIIEVSYLVTTNYSKPNECRLFNFDGSIGNTNQINIVTTQIAVGGDVKESIESIKLNATKSNSAKYRNVKESDYELALKSSFNFIQSASVWGGEKNVPPVYGKVFISVQPKTGYTISDSIKRDVLTPVIRQNSIMNAIPEFVDPEYLLVEFNTLAKFNSSLTVSSRLSVSMFIKNAVSSYIQSISTFNKDYINSKMIGYVANVDAGLVGIAISKKVGFRVSPLIAVKTYFNRSIHNSIKENSITSTKFNTLHNGVVIPVVIREIPNSQTSKTVNGVAQTITSIGVYNETGEVLSAIGTVNLTTGKFEFYIDVNSYLTKNRFVQIMCELVYDDIQSAQNQILVLDSTVAEDSTIGLAQNNRVEITNYIR